MALTPSSAWAARPVRGVYSVPTDDPALKSAAEFPVRFKADHYDRNPASLTFPLPTELTGTPVSVTMTRDAADPSKWSGPQVNGTCAKTGRVFSCRMEFRDLPIDPDLREQAIAAKNPDSIQAALVRRVVEQFADQPVGILKYRLRGGQE